MNRCDGKIIEKLKRPQGKVRVVIDTDTYNEIDDQYALSYALSLPERVQVEAICAAPFYNAIASSPEEGMEKSYQEILRLLPLLGREELQDKIYKGSKDYLTDEKTPQESAAARKLVELAMAMQKDEPLYVVSLAAITNVASALLMEPAIAERIVIVWLGGHSYCWKDTREFNLIQDVAAARVVFDSGVPLVQIPCMGVSSHLQVTEPELRECMKNQSKVGEYLYRITCDIAAKQEGICWSRVIWDLAAMMWVAGPADCLTEHLVYSPVVSYEGMYSVNPNRHMIKVVDWLDRDRVFATFFKHLQAIAEREGKGHR